MDYVITDEGLKLLEETSLREVVHDNRHAALEGSVGHMYEGDIKDYLETNRVHPSLAKKPLEEIEDDDEFRIFSFIYPNELVKMGKILANLPDKVMTAIGAYIKTDRWTNPRYEKNFSFRDSRFITCINADVHGDFFLQQYNHSVDKSELLFPEASPLVKKLRDEDKGRLYGHYDYWTEFLQHLIYYCCQTKREVPFRNNFEQVFYNGRLPSETPGMVAEPDIRDLIYRGNPELMKGTSPRCLPLYPGWEKQRDAGWHPLEGQIEGSQGFIVDDNLVYCHADAGGVIEFAHQRFAKPGVFITPNMIEPLMRGAITLIRDGAGRNQPQDSGLILKHFPYHLFEQ